MKRSILFFAAVLPLLAAGQIPLAWDSGVSQTGTAVYVNSNPYAGLYLFEVTTASSAGTTGFWRSVLNVESGEADLFISTSPSVTTNNYVEKSDTVGSERIIRSLPGGLRPGICWFALRLVQSGAFLPATCM
ncbi:hypothetical protein EGM51_06955 [Verrucomicrobia bacterium S94]|nr:hypothetical protein EGM51_06955 [Verrucomicrobia bacterium S94]